MNYEQRHDPTSTELQSTVKERFAKDAQPPDQEKKFPVAEFSPKGVADEAESKWRKDLIGYKQ